MCRAPRMAAVAASSAGRPPPSCERRPMVRRNSSDCRSMSFRKCVNCRIYLSGSGVARTQGTSAMNSSCTKGRPTKDLRTSSSRELNPKLKYSFVFSRSGLQTFLRDSFSGRPLPKRLNRQSETILHKGACVTAGGPYDRFLSHGLARYPTSPIIRASGDRRFDA